MLVLRTLAVLAMWAGCASEVALPAAHPAARTAPTGRLAGAPPSLRAGVIAYPDVPALRPEGSGAAHHHHHP